MVERKWYVLHAKSGHEMKAKQEIEEAVEREHMEELVGRVMVPTEQVIEMKNGQKRNAERKFFPGYMLINMALNEKSWLFIKQMKHINGFIGGSSGKPNPISDYEANKVFSRIQEGVDKPRPKVAYQPGQEILVTDGPFSEFSGTVESVNYEKSSLKIEVLIFGRTTSIELGFSQVAKA